MLKYYNIMFYYSMYRSLIAGLAWVKHSSDPRGPSPVHIRHTCEHGDGLNKFGWIRHDGATFGQQEIIDGSNYKNIAWMFYI